MAHDYPGQPLLTGSGTPGVTRVTRDRLREGRTFYCATFQPNEQFMTIRRSRPNHLSAAPTSNKKTAPEEAALE